MALTKSIVNYNDFSIEHYINYTYHVDYADYNGKMYSDKAPGSSFMAIPAYLLCKIVGIKNIYHQTYIMTILTVSLFSSLLFLIFYKIVGRLTRDKNVQILTTITLGLGTLLFPYSTIFFGRNLAAFFSFAAFYLIFLVKRDTLNENYLILSGALTAFGFLTDYFAGVAIPFLIFYVLTFNRKRGFLKFLIPLLAFSSLALVYNQVLFDDFLSFPYKYQAFYKEAQSYGLYGITTPKPEVILELTFLPHRGLFIFSPILILTFWGLYYNLKKSKFKIESIICILIFVSLLLVNSGFSVWDGGWSFGPRYLIPSLPFLTLLIYPVYQRRKLNYLAIPLLLISTSIMLLGTLTNVTPGAENPIMGIFLYEKIGQRNLLFESMKSFGIPLWISGILVILTLCAIIFFPINSSSKIRSRLKFFSY